METNKDINKNTPISLIHIRITSHACILHLEIKYSIMHKMQLTLPCSFQIQDNILDKTYGLISRFICNYEIK